MDTDQRREELRRRAEEYLRQARPAVDDRAYQDMESLLHDLQVHQIELTLQNEELRQAQQELEESRNRFVDLYDFAPIGYLTVDQHGLIVQANLTGATMLGRERQELLRLSIAHLIVNEDQDVYYLHRQDILETKTRQSCELRMRRKDEVPFWGSLECTPVVDKNETVTHIRITISDISERKQLEEELKKRLAEREELLKEVYHRVKNNFMSVTSLLSMQINTDEDPRTSKVLQESIHRIRSMSLIHERLYQSDNLAEIDFGECLYQIAAELFQTYNTAGTEIRLKMEQNPVLLSAGKGIPCAMLANELVSNALKYAFPRGRSGEIRLKVHEQDDHVTLVVSDNGVGLPEDLDLQHSKSLGLELVRAFAQQLRGTFDLDRTNGTTFTLRFPK